MNKETNINHKLSSLVLLFAFWLLYAFVEFQFVAWIVKSGHVQIIQRSSTLSPLEIIVVTTFIYPFVEEIIFRLPLKIKLSYIVISLASATWYYWFRIEGFPSEAGMFFNYSLLAPIVISLLLVSLFYQPKYAAKVLAMLNDHYKPFAVTLVFCFAASHWAKLNYDSLFFGVIFIFIVYFNLGVFLSYVRVKVNFGTALFFHILHNSIPYLILLYHSIKQGKNLFNYI